MFREHTLRMPSPEQALPGRTSPLPVAAKHFVLGTPMEPPFPAGMRAALFGMGCFWGAERKFWSCRASTRRRSATRPDTRRTRPTRSVLRPDRAQRGRPRRLRSEGRPLRRAAEGVLGEPRPDAGHAAGQRRRHAVSLRHLHATATRSSAPPRRRARRTSERSPRRATAPITTEILPTRRSSTTPRTITSSTWRRTPTATAASAGPE